MGSPLQVINADEGNRQKWDESLPPPNKNQKSGAMSKHKESENETSASETSEINGVDNPSQKRTNKLSLAKNGKKSKNKNQKEEQGRRRRGDEKDGAMAEI